MQREASGLYKSLQIYQLNSTNLIPEPDQALRCSFPFAGPTTVQGVFLRMPGPTADNPRWLVLRIERCSAPFPFDRVIVDRANNSTPGPNVRPPDPLRSCERGGRESDVGLNGFAFIRK